MKYMLHQAATRLILLATIIIAISCTPTETYVNSVTGIMLKHPSDWQLYERSADSFALEAPYYDSSSSISFKVVDSTLVRDPISYLQEVSTTALEVGSLRSADSPELISIGNYHAARMRAVGRLPSLDMSMISDLPTATTKTPNTYDEQVEFVVIMSENKTVFVSIIQPSKETERIINSFYFSP